MRNEFTPEWITELKDNEIFVFGSNLAGAHGGELLEWLMTDLVLFGDKV